MYVFRPQGKEKSCIMLHMISPKCFMSHRFKVIWPCLSSWYCIAPFLSTLLCFGFYFISETMYCFALPYGQWYITSLLFYFLMMVYISHNVTSLTWICTWLHLFQFLHHSAIFYPNLYFSSFNQLIQFVCFFTKFLVIPAHLKYLNVL